MVLSDRLLSYLCVDHALCLSVKDGAEVIPNDNVELVFFGARSSLNISSVTAEDCGTYTCEAENSTGLVDCHAQLTLESEGMVGLKGSSIHWIAT